MGSFGDLRDALAARGYVIELELGRGGMGVVYLARQTSLDRLVAVKAILADDTLFAGNLRRFHREARIVKDLVHPNIARLLDYDLTSGQPYLVFEYIEGGRTLANVIAEGSLSAAQNLMLAEQIAEGLGFIHRRQIVHRDLKPTNVLVDSSRTPKIIDLGLARAVTADETRLTLAGQVLGTFAYMPPEQLLGDEADARCDVYSFGLLLFELVAGRPVFSAAAPDVVTPMARLSGRLPALSTFRPRVTADLEGLINRCLATERERRPPDCGVVLDELAQLSLARRKLSTTVGIAVDHPSVPHESDLLARPTPRGLADPAVDLGRTVTVASPLGQRAPRLVQRATGRGAPWTARTGLAVLAAGVGLCCLLALAVSSASWRHRGLPVPLEKRPPMGSGSPSDVALPAAASRATFELERGRLYLRFLTSQPASTRFVGRMGSQAMTLAEDRERAEHRIMVGKPDVWDGLSGPRVEYQARGAQPMEPPLGQALRNLVVRELVPRLKRLHREVNERLGSIGRNSWLADPASLEAVLANPVLVQEISAMAPWSQKVLGETEVPADVRLDLWATIQEVQVLDQLCPTRLRGGKGQVRALLPAVFRQQPLSPVNPLDQMLQANLREVSRTPIGIGSHEFLGIHTVASAGDFFTLRPVRGLAGYEAQPLADTLLSMGSPMAHHQLSSSSAPSTGLFVVRLPEQMVSPERVVFVAMPRGCRAGERLRVLKVNGRKVLLDQCCPPTDEGRAVYVRWAFGIPCGLFRKGDNEIECYQDDFAWVKRDNTLWFLGFTIYSIPAGAVPAVVAALAPR